MKPTADFLSAHSDSFSPEILLCPACSNSLQRNNDCLACSQGHTYSFCDGIPVLSKNLSYHFMSPTKEQMEGAFAIMDQNGFWSGMDYLTKDKDQEALESLHHYMMSETRAAWKILLPEIQEKRILDYACGWGNLSIALGRSAKEVVGIDLSLQRVRFAKRHSEHLGLRNVHWVSGGDSVKLPFPDGYFDIVVMNGILEWIPTSRDLDKSPAAAQLSFLKELFRITKPNGMVCLAIENRIGLKYFLGSKDEHSQLRFITFLPRWISDLYSKRMRGKPFREYTHSISGYRKLLDKAGFDAFQPYIPFPSYRQFDTLLAYQDPKQVTEHLGRLRKITRANALVTAVLPQFANAFVIFAGKSDWRNSQSLAEKLATRFPPLSPGQIRSWRVLGTGSALAYGREQTDTSSRPVVIKVPLIPKALQSNAAAFENLRCLHEARLPDWIKSMLPSPVERLQLDGFDCFVQTRLPGKEGTMVTKDSHTQDAILGRAVGLITRLHKDSAHVVTFTEEIFAASVRPGIRAGLELLERKHGAKSVGALEQGICSLLVGKRIPLVLSHGDFWLKNILFDTSTHEPVGIIDWDRMQIQGPPVTDLLNLLLMERKRTGHRDWHERVTAVITQVKPASRKGTVLDYFNALMIPDASLNALCAIYFLQRLPEERFNPTDADLSLIQNILKST